VARRIINTPSFDFLHGMYYAKVLEVLVRNLRDNVPEITNENEGEPAMQLLSAFALAAHLSNVFIDITAFESLLSTAQLRDTVVAFLKLIGFEVAGDTPAAVDLLITLSKKTYTSTEEVIPALAKFATRRRSADAPINYETQQAYSVNRNDQLTKAFVYDASGPTYTDKTTQANTDAVTWAVLPATPAAGDALYIGHDTNMTNRVKVTGMTTAMANVMGVWEYCDTELDDDRPDEVVDGGSTLRVVVNTLLGTDGSVNFAGLPVTVTLNSTGTTETEEVQYDGDNYVTIGYLGQITPSEDENDYSVGTNWHALTGLDDDTDNGTSSMQGNGNIDFILPQTTIENWQPIEVNGVTAFWLRFRVISVGGGPVAAVVDRLKWNDRDNFILISGEQGRTVSGEVLGSSDGTPSQAFTPGNQNVIDGTVAVSVDATTWTEVQNFLSSTSVDEHYTVELDSNGLATVTFGDGINGKIPPSGTNNIIATYRVEANLDGNVGADTITVNRDGVSNVKAVTNPRAASGWVERRGNTVEDRERLKIEGPASLRTLDRAVTTADVEYLTTQFKNSDGRKPFVRCHCVEEGFGAKTVKAVTVGPGGASTTSDDRQQLETYFNGDADRGTAGVMVANQRVFARDYTPVLIDVTGTFTGDADVESVVNALTAFLSPVAVREDGITFRWNFGDTVTLSSIIGAVIKVAGVDDFTMTVPSSNTLLTDEQLPATGTLSITKA
jgi:hypothetical protein